MWRTLFRQAPRQISNVSTRSNQCTLLAPNLYSLNSQRVFDGLEQTKVNLYQAFTTFACIRKGEEPEIFDFQTETRQVLDIVTHSLYTDREVFLRELVSNANDALEKARHLSLTSSDVDGGHPLEITLETDEKAGTFTISDSGVGMTRDELLSHLGTIARSGTKAFLKDAKEKGQQLRDDAIIGKFGVGFYAAFMVADKVEVFTKSALPNSEALLWTSKGDGRFSIQSHHPDGHANADLSQIDAELAPSDADLASVDAGPLSLMGRGTKIVLHLKEDAREYASKKKLRQVVEKYSNFVTYPIIMEGSRLNTVQALWSRGPKEVTSEEHSEFFKFLSPASYGAPHYTLHFVADAPLSIQALFYIPAFNKEKFGFGDRDEDSISLYSRKVLIQAKCSSLLPAYMRFVTGVVDCEDIPLNISRETTQDSALIAKLKEVLTQRLLKFLASKASSKTPEDQHAYEQFYVEFGTNIKEGICSEKSEDKRNKMAPLFRCESSFDTADTPENMGGVSLDHYVDRCPDTQDSIYFICAPSRSMALSSAYMEAFKRSNTEVLLLYGPMDEFVMRHLATYRGKKIVNVESAELAVPEVAKESADENTEEKKADKKLPEEDVARLCEWIMKEVLSDKQVESVRASARLVESAAMLVGHKSAATMRLHHMQMNMSAGHRDSASLGMQDLDGPIGVLEINPSHPIIRKLSEIQFSGDDKAKEIAKAVVWQVFDNAKIEAGVLGDPRSMLNRLNTIMDAAI